MTQEEARQLRRGDLVTPNTQLEDVPLGTVGTVHSVISHEEFGGGIEIHVAWPVQGPGFMDPEILKRVTSESTPAAEFFPNGTN
ncbi:MAG: hypothetical protein ACR2FO_05535 [Actinomycetota bacterium]